MDLQAFCSRACAFALAWMLFGSPAQAHSFDRVRVLSNDEIIDATGRSVTEWGNAWWTWAFEHSEIFGDNPITGEPTGGTVELYAQLTLRSIARPHHRHHHG